MFASMLTNIEDWQYLLASPIPLVITVFQIWMLIHAVRNREWIWAVFIVIGWGLSSILYFIYVYRATPSSMQGFELPGAHDRRRIRELEAQIYHLDKAHHHSQLGDIYFQHGKLDKAEGCYRAALERDPQDLDTRAHFGQCLLRQKRAAEARPLLEGVIRQNPNHEYGYTMMALAETLTAVGESDSALKMWQEVTANHSYPRAKVQLAELYVTRKQNDLARVELKDVLNDDLHAPAFQRKRDRVWIRRAKSLMQLLPR